MLKSANFVVNYYFMYTSSALKHRF